MLTKSDFQRAIADGIDNYPAIAPLYRAGDPRIIQNLDAMATMLAMISVQIEVAQAEPFEKVRDATVLADAAMRGVIRKSRPGRVRIAVSNQSDGPYTLEVARNVLDSQGNIYHVDTPLTLPAGAYGAVDATQIKSETLTHTVSGSEPFYAIEIPEAEDGSYLSGISVSDGAGEFEYRERYVNTLPNERVYHIETDDRQRIYVRFGYGNVVGYQPADGHVITLTIYRSIGIISPGAGSPFSFEYLQSPQESAIDISLHAVLDKGDNPPDMVTLRDLAKYPSVYDHSAVYLGEFDFLVRRNYTSLKFLSVWNESAEEAIRGPSLDNINTLFVACFLATEQVLVETDPAIALPPTIIPSGSLTETQQKILATIKRADDSYKVKFLTPVKSKIAVTINATVSSSFVPSDVRSQIAEVLLQEFGEDSNASKRGSNRPLYQTIYALLRAKVPALSAGRADMTVNIAEPTGGYRPELWRYVATDSLSITVQTANVTLPSWGL
jgi:hypothetical protein